MAYSITCTCIYQKIVLLNQNQTRISFFSLKKKSLVQFKSQHKSALVIIPEL